VISVLFTALFLVACGGGSKETATSDSTIDTATYQQPTEWGDFTVGAYSRCDAPIKLAFAEVAGAMGIQGTPNFDAAHDHDGGALAIDDFDGDGDLDVVMALKDDLPGMFRREGDEFVREEIETWSQVPPSIWSLGLGDFDSDGDNDLTMAGRFPIVLENTGGTFSPFAWLPVRYTSSTVIRDFVTMDIDLDGSLDMYAVRAKDSPSGGPAPAEEMVDYILYGAGDGTFTLDDSYISEELGGGMGFDGRALDFDGDGYLDLYLANDMATQNHLLFGSENGLVDVPDQSSGCEPEMHSMSVDFADFTGDGLGDLVITDSNNSRLLIGIDGGCVDYTEVTEINSGHEGMMGWGGISTDLDNDGEVDILVAHGDLSGGAGAELPVAWYRNQDGLMVESGATLGFDQTGSFRGLVATDHNGDGVLDPMVTSIADVTLFYMSEGCTENSWFEVEAPSGSRVELDVGEEQRVSWVSNESGWSSSGPSVAHFGLGAETHVSGLRVVTPMGDVYTATGNLLARRRVRVE